MSTAKRYGAGGACTMLKVSCMRVIAAGIAAGTIIAGIIIV